MVIVAISVTVSLFSEAVKTADDDTASHDPQIEEIIATATDVHGSNTDRSTD
jgi:hypothetical protein